MGFGSQLVAQKLTSLAEELSPWVRLSTLALTTLYCSSVSVALLASNLAVTVPTHMSLRLSLWGAVSLGVIKRDGVWYDMQRNHAMHIARVRMCCH